MGHNPDDFEERMDFINDLPDENLGQFVYEILDQLKNKEK